MRDLHEFTQGCRIVVGALIADHTGAIVNTDYVSMKNYGHCTALIFLGTLTASDAMLVTALQATEVAGVTTKALTLLSYYTGVKGSAVVSDTMTRVLQATTALSIASTQDDEVIAVEIDAESLDVDNGYDCFRLDIGSPGAHAALYGVLFILTQPRYLPSVSAIID